MLEHLNHANNGIYFVLTLRIRSADSSDLAELHSQRKTVKKFDRQQKSHPFSSKMGGIYFVRSRQQVAPKKISVPKTQEPQRFLGFFVPFFKVEFKRYHFLKTTFGEDLNYRPRLSGADFAEFFARSAPFFVSGFVKCLCLGGCA